ncbi:MAG: HEAT repeat domain-containing protein [Bradymonadaceae bacterium]|nr:HEAT repeat domain-containing protein [Lujinxingiaceae bacterium]
MKRKLIIVSLISIFAGTSLLTGIKPSMAQSGPSADLAEIDRPELVPLKAQIERLRVENPMIFVRLDELKASVIRADRNKRGRLAPVSGLFKALGPEALLPMLSAIATESPIASGMRLSAWTVYRAAMIEAVGDLRDPRAFGVLQAVLKGNEHNVVVLSAASEALGKLDDDASIAALLEIATRAGSKQDAIIAGLASARRPDVATFLAQHLLQTTNPDSKIVAMGALSSVANSWAWQTTRLANSQQGDRTRQIAAEALFAIFVSGDARLRAEATRALLLVDHPSTALLIADARPSTDRELADALDGLNTRLANNPLNRK